MLIYNDDERVAEQPPTKKVKRIERIVNLVSSEPPPCPKLNIPMTFFLTPWKPDRILNDVDFMDTMKKDAADKRAEVVDKRAEAADKKSDTSDKRVLRVIMSNLHYCVVLCFCESNVIVGNIY